MKIYIPEQGQEPSGPDAVFMTECAKVDHNPPETWQKYDRKTDAGAYNIMIMEINELKKAHDSGNIPELLENAQDSGSIRPEESPPRHRLRTSCRPRAGISPRGINPFRPG